MAEKLLKLKELRIRLAGPEGLFHEPPAPATIREWERLGLKTHLLPGGKRKLYLFSEVLAFLKERMKLGAVS